MSGRASGGRSSLLLTLVIVLLAAGPAAAAAAPAWIAPAPGAEATSHSQSNPLVGIDGAGYVISVWDRFDPGSSTRVIEARIRPPGGPARPSVQLSPAGSSGASVALAVAANGRAVAVWDQGGEIHVAVRPPGGVFGTARQFPQEAGETSFDPDVGLDAAGNAVVVWSSVQAAPAVRRIRWATLPAGGEPGAAQLVRETPSPNRQLTTPVVAVDPAGRAHALWIYALVETGDRTTTVEHAYRAVGGPLDYVGELDSKFESPFNAEIPNGVQNPHVAIDDQGRAVGAWLKPGPPHAVRWSAGSAGGSFTPAADLPGGARLLSGIATSPGGQALIATMPFADPSTADVSTRQPGGAFGAPETIAPLGVERVIDIEVGRGGDAVLTWIRGVGGDNRPQAAYRRRGTTTWITTTLAPDNPSAFSGTLAARAAIDAAGNAALAWSDGDGSAFRDYIGGYDAEGPRFSTVQVPTPVERGTRLEVSAAAYDVWNTATLGWRFGSGPLLAGAAASHVFQRAGLFTATATATDALGNVSATTRQIRVRDTRRPRVSKLRFVPRRFAVAKKKGRASAARVKRGSSLRFRLNEPARVRVTVTKGKRKLRAFVHRKRRVGANRIRFTGRLSRKRALAPGRYRVVVQAIDPSGNRSARKRAGFRIVVP